ncbi:MAG: restriction endonuclease subunit S [Deltaproteobacteria bacterium]|nr:restriction endonuclease subunit S [Deltaproteobacteria bacterium]
MAGEWDTATIDEVAERVAMGPFGSSIKVETFVAQGVPVISGQHLHGFRLDETSGFNFLSPEHANRLKNANVQKGDIIFTHAGNIGQVSYIPESSEYERYVISQRQFYMRCNRQRAIPEFVVYYFNTPEGRHKLLANTSQVGVPSIAQPVTYLRTIEIPLPPLPEQRAIAHILGTLVDKIELNRRMNETLEAIARAIFKSWFVDFDPVRTKMNSRWGRGQTLPGLPAHLYDLFPDRLEDSELGEIPAGWAVKRIEEVAERVAMGPFGSSIKVETFVPEGVPIISGQHLNGFVMEDNTFNFITQEHAMRLANAVVQRGDVIFTHAGNIGQAAFIPKTSRYERYVISQRQFFMRCDLSQVSPAFIALYFNSLEGQHKLLANTSSSGVPSIARPVTYLRSIQIPIPPRVVMDEFDKIVSALLLRLCQNKVNNDTLAALRDALLPRLISGQLRVKDAERFISEANL